MSVNHVPNQMENESDPVPKWVKTASNFTFQNLKFYGVALVVLGLYFALAKLGLYLASLNQSASPVWPATGFAIASTVLLGKRYLVGIAMGAFLVDFQSGLDILPSLIIAAGNTFEALFAASLYQRVRTNSLFGNHSQSFACIVSSIGGSIFSATIGCVTLYAFSKVMSDQLLAVWSTWWIGNFIGGLTVFPQILALCKFHFRRKQLLPGSLNIFLSSALALFVFHTIKGAPFLFLVFPFLIFCTAKLGKESAYIASGLFSVFGIVATYHGFGVFNSGSLNSNLINLQIFLSSIAVTALFLPELWRSANNRQTALVLIVSWGMAAVTFYFLYMKGQDEIENNFSKIVSSAEQRLTTQTQHFLTALKSGVGLFNASQSVEKTEWHDFASEIDSQNKRNGLMGMGVIFRVSEPKLKDFLNEKSLENNGEFHYRSLNALKWPKDEAYVVTYLEPLDLNVAAIGLDIATETNRKEAADRAARTGEAALTDSIHLIRSERSDQGFLVLYPFYAKGTVHSDEASRLRSHLGWIYSPVNADSFFSSAFGPAHTPELSYGIYKTESKRLLSYSKDFFSENQQNLKYVRERHLEVAGQSFTLVVKPSAKFTVDVDSTSSWAGSTAALIGILLASLVSNLQFTRERVEEIVDERTRQLDITGKVAKVGGWDLDPMNRVVNLSSVAKIILGYNESESPSWEAIFQLLGTNSAKRSLQQQVATHDFFGGSFETTFELKNAANQNVWVRIIAMSNSGAESGRYYYGAIQDVSDQKAKDLMLVHASKMASLGEMASGVAHEINNPLMIITGKVYKINRILREAQPDIKLCEKELVEIGHTVSRIANIIKGLKTFSRNGDMDPFSISTLVQVIDDTLFLCAERFRNAGISLQVEAIPGDLLHIRPTQISQVLLNLLNNSFDAISNETDKWILVGFDSSNSKFIDIRVTDSGPPIPTEVIEKLMQPFFTTKEIGKGTGIGLSISRGIAQSHNGDFFLDRKSQNTTFILRLPRDS